MAGPIYRDRNGGKMNSYGNVTSGTYGTISEPLVVREVPDFIPIVGREDTPLASMIPKGGSRNLTKWEFGEGDLASRNDKITASYLVGATSIVVATPAKFQKWNLIRNSKTGEVMLVTAVDDSTSTLTVTRGWGAGNVSPLPAGVAAAASAGANDEIQIINTAIPEGAVSPLSPIQQGELYVTYPQIMEYRWTFTHRGKLTPTYEVKTDRFKHELKRKMKEAAKDLDRAMLHGIATPGDGNASGNNPSTMGGLRQYTNVYTTNVGSTNPLTFSHFMDQLQVVYKDVGRQNMGKTIMGSMFTKRIFNSFFQGSRRSTQKDSKTNMVWDEVETDFGVLKFVTHYDMPDNELFIWNPDDCKLITFEGGAWETGLYPSDGWFYQGFLRGDMGVLFEGARRRCRIYGYSTTKSDYPYIDRAYYGYVS